MSSRIILLDTSYVLALENSKDPHHQRAKLLDRQLLRQSALSVIQWGILIEIANGYARVDRRAKALQLLEKFETEERYFIYPITDSLLQGALQLYRARSDKDWGVTETLTAGVHFRQAGFTALLLESS